MRHLCLDFYIHVAMIFAILLIGAQPFEVEGLGSVVST